MGRTDLTNRAVPLETALADLEGVPGIAVRAGAEGGRARRPTGLASG